MKKAINFAIRNIPRKQLIKLSYIFKFFSKYLYYGNKYECPVCGSTFRKMLPYGVLELRDNAMCPKCLSLERHRLLWLFLQQKTNLFTAPTNLLHIAPEQCFIPIFKQTKTINYTTADLESPIADVKLDVQNMPLDDNSYDVVICNHVLEHIDDDRKALSEIYRVLKKGGFAILLVPADINRNETYEDPSITDPLEREKLFYQKDHVRLYGLDYPERIKAAGFTIKDIDFYQSLSDADKKRYALPKNEFMFAAYKS